MIDFWRGEHYERSPQRILLLGESTYGDDPPLQTYIRQWLDGPPDADNTFKRISLACCDGDADEQRAGFWGALAFTNFVTRTLATSKDRPSEKEFAESVEPLRQTLALLKPRAVWILGKMQAAYSAPVVQDFGAEFEVVVHPAYRYGPTHELLRESWLSLQAKLASAPTNAA